MSAKKRLTNAQIMQMVLDEKANPKPQVTVNIDGKRQTVLQSAYVKAKTAQLVQFGYSGLTEEHVATQLEAILAGKTMDDGLDVIGGFMQDEVELPKEAQPRGEEVQATDTGAKQLQEKHDMLLKAAEGCIAQIQEIILTADYSLARERARDLAATLDSLNATANKLADI